MPSSGSSWDCIWPNKIQYLDTVVHPHDHANIRPQLKTKHRHDSFLFENNETIGESLFLDTVCFSNSALSLITSISQFKRIKSSGLHCNVLLSSWLCLVLCKTWTNYSPIQSLEVQLISIVKMKGSMVLNTSVSFIFYFGVCRMYWNRLLLVRTLIVYAVCI